MAARSGKTRSDALSSTVREGSVRGRTKLASRHETAPDVYQEMLSEIAASATHLSDEGRPAKKLKTASARPSTMLSQPHSSITSSPVVSRKQVIYDDSLSSEGSDVDWEEVGLPQQVPEEKPTAADRATAKDISIVIGQDGVNTSKARTTNRLASTALEKKKRLEIHKVHLCCLLVHAYVRNAWCNDEDVQFNVKHLLNNRTISYLNPDPEHSQFQRSRSFLDGLQQASDVFTPAYKITAKGLRQPIWAVNPMKLSESSLSKDPEQRIDKKAFRRTAKRREGSRDAGAQLFCAMLRSAGVDARLVCSLQPLSFTSAPPSQPAPKSKPTIIYAGSDSEMYRDSEAEGTASASSRPASANGDAVTPHRIKRLGASSKPADLGKAPPTTAKRMKIIESHSPVFWVEAFNTALQTWIPVDPLVTHTINKAHKFEPPVSDSTNSMSYVVAFEEDGSARDVTRRYAKAYNAKTRRVRVEATKGGERWWRKALKLFKIALEDRDQVEDAELAKKEASEPLPRNVQDFKDHPYYALERHLRRNEVIHPRREVGKLSAGKTSNGVEPIYRRRDVQIVRTADKWYRSGREIKPGEQPLKYAAKRHNRKQRSPSAESDASDGDLGLGLYAEFQTDIYIPPPVVRGRVPKNDFGNLDIYVPSMIPPGGVHVRAVEAPKAARILGVDFAEAVTGFTFRGRHGTAVVNGAVIAMEYKDAIEEVVKGLRWETEVGEARKRSAEALRMWKKFMVGLRVRERIMGYEAEGEEGNDDGKGTIMEFEEEEEPMKEEGGFFPDRDQEAARPTAERFDPENGTMADPTYVINEPADVHHLNLPLDSYDVVNMSLSSPWDMPDALFRISQGPSPSRASLKSTPPGEKLDLKRVSMYMLENQEGSGKHGEGGFIHEFPDKDAPTSLTGHPHGSVTPAAQQFRPHSMLAGDSISDPYTAADMGAATEGSGFLLDEEGDSLRGGGFLIEADDEQQDATLSSEANPEQHGRLDTVLDTRNTGEGSGQGLLNAEKRHADKGDNNDGGVHSDGDRDGDGDDLESLLSEDPEDEDAEPEWLA